MRDDEAPTCPTCGRQLEPETVGTATAVRVVWVCAEHGAVSAVDPFAIASVVPMSNALVTLRFRFLDQGTRERPGSDKVVELIEAESKSFLAALVVLAPHESDHPWFWVHIEDPESEQRISVLVDKRATFGQVKELAGDEVLFVDNLGRGGGGGWTPLSDLIGELPAIGKVARFGRSLYGAILSNSYREERAEVKEWDDTGVVSAKLTQMVMRENPWIRSHFDSVFALTRSRGSELLRHHGYERSGIADGIEYWTERSPL